MNQGYNVCKRDRQGSALILVVGMLALMITLAVTFAVFMRTEQLAAGSFLNDVTSRQYMKAALAHALDDIETKVGTNMYPRWDVITSSGTDVYTNALYGSVTNWIPWGAFVQTMPDDVKPGWLWMGTVPGFKAKVAYIVLNCSGLLDANYAGGGSRACGTTPEEIEVSDVDEAKKPDYKAARPFATQQELNLRGFLKESARSLVTYSAFPNFYSGGTNRNLVDISGDTNRLFGYKVQIKNAYLKSVDGASGEDAEFFFNNLLDYVDFDDLPRDLGSPCTERVPMVNEVRARVNLLDVDPATKTCRSMIEVQTETFFPFVADGANYKVLIDVVATNNTAASGKYVPPPFHRETDVVAGSYQLQEHEASYLGPIMGCETTDVVNITIRVGVKVINLSKQVVDAVPYPYATNVFLRMDCPPMIYPSVATGEKLGEWKGHECIDPRFNWDTASDAWHPYGEELVGSGSMDPPGENKIVKFLLRTDNAGDYDSFTGLHVANESLRNAGELSFLLRSKREINGRSPYWNGLKLFADNRTLPLDRVLDEFIVSSNQVQHGLINVNSHSVLAWSDVFYNAPKDKYPGEIVSGADRVSGEESMKMALVMTNFVGIPLVRLSDIGMATNLISAAGLDDELNVLKQRSILRNISSLIDLRQQYFIVLMYGIPTYTKDQGEVASVQAVAEVWRDPFSRSGDGVHPKIIRSFKILEAW